MFICKHRNLSTECTYYNHIKPKSAADTKAWNNVLECIKSLPSDQYWHGVRQARFAFSRMVSRQVQPASEMTSFVARQTRILCIPCIAHHFSQVHCMTSPYLELLCHPTRCCTSLLIALLNYAALCCSTCPYLAGHDTHNTAATRNTSFPFILYYSRKLLCTILGGADTALLQ